MMEKQYMIHQTHEEERFADQARYDDSHFQSSSASQKIYPHAASLSTGRLVLAIVSLAVWLIALFMVIVTFPGGSRGIIETGSNGTSRVVENMSSGLGVDILIAFVLLSIFLCAVNFLVRKRSS